MQLAALIQEDRGLEIVAWLQADLAEAVNELHDFRIANRRIEARDHRLRRLLAKLDDKVDRYDEDDDDQDWERRWARSEKLWEERRELDRLIDEDPELGWYWDQVGDWAARISRDQQRIRLAKDVAGIELIPTRRRWREEEQSLS